MISFSLAHFDHAFDSLQSLISTWRAGSTQYLQLIRTKLNINGERPWFGTSTASFIVFSVDILIRQFWRINKHKRHFVLASTEDANVDSTGERWKLCMHRCMLRSITLDIDGGLRGMESVDVCELLHATTQTKLILTVRGWRICIYLPRAHRQMCDGDGYAINILFLMHTKWRWNFIQCYHTANNEYIEQNEVTRVW